MPTRSQGAIIKQLNDDDDIQKKKDNDDGIDNEIKKRQKIAIYLVKNNNFKEKLKDSLKKITDFERSLLRISLNALNPKELLISIKNIITRQIKTKRYNFVTLCIKLSNYN